MTCKQDKEKEDNHQTNIDQTSNEKNQDVLKNFPKKYQSQIIEKNKLWMGSWKSIDSSFDLKDFNEEFKKKIKIKWGVFDKNEFSSIDSLFIISSFNWIVDLYSYNTVIEKRDGKMFLSFGVDQNIYIYDSNRITSLVSLGSIETIEDAIWLNEGKKLLLLGYLENNEGTSNPILWLFDFESMEQIRYVNSSVSMDSKTNYLKYKYPNLIIE